ncbi:LysR family transcriptional regulator [Caballeronia insecticola]|uniref:Transcriptional regulator LysR family n=1 Tax=Caballeronia insecticola TaxID=758793 RepID=A0A060PJV7_9BURK|nr:LysR family transcriptional regulator [Caballeronia insecticola]BAO94203.1 transcriptional regulator LysR family [Caballeronia insecticola]
MDKLKEMEVFTKIVEMNSFSRAAEAMEMTPATATIIVQRLEARLDVRLLHRTTRRLKLTDEGAEFYKRCAQVLAEIEESEHALTGHGKRPLGRLHVEMPGSLGRFVVLPQLSQFRSMYPDLELMIGLSNNQIDLVEEGVDCAIRVGVLPDSSLGVRRLGALELVTLASPAYLKRHGTPRTLAELDSHASVHYFSNRTGRTLNFSFEEKGEPTEVRMNGRLGFNDAEAYVLAGVHGLGIVQAPRYIAHAHMASGALVEVLPQFKPHSRSVSAIFPHNKHLAPKVRVFLDWAADLFAQCPLLMGQGSAGTFPDNEKGRKTSFRSVMMQDRLDELAL